MKVDIEDVLFWMDAIRNSEDRYRTLESFWKGQVRSKIWLIENLKPIIRDQKDLDITIYGGWNGVLASLMFNSLDNISHITSIDVDPVCQQIANTVNKRQELLGKFSALTADMCSHSAVSDIVINTSCEHITPDQYTLWLSNVPESSIVVVQSNNFFDCTEHVNCMNSLAEFEESSRLKTIRYSGQLDLPLYSRYMIIGQK